jgi:hypothetical protein
MKIWFWLLWWIDAVIAAVALYFFFSLAAGGNIGSFNILPWLAILGALAAVIGGSVWLRSVGAARCRDCSSLDASGPRSPGCVALASGFSSSA